MRVPSAGPRTKECEMLLAYYYKRLARFERVPPSRREAECADEGEATCRAMIAELEGTVTLGTLSHDREGSDHP